MQRFIISFLFITSIFSCNVNKKSKLVRFKDSSELKIEKAFMQEEIPGTQGEVSVFYVNVQIGPLTNTEIVLDSILFNSPNFKKVSMAASRFMKFQLTKRVAENQVPEGMPNQATIYFHKGNQHYRQTIRPLLTIEPIYLP